MRHFPNRCYLNPVEEVSARSRARACVRACVQTGYFHPTWQFWLKKYLHAQMHITPNMRRRTSVITSAHPGALIGASAPDRYGQSARGHARPLPSFPHLSQKPTHFTYILHINPCRIQECVPFASFFKKNSTTNN